MTNPSFLNLFDNDPKEAFRLFFIYTRDLLKRQPPRPLGILKPDEKEDVTNDIVYHCVKDDFKVLRGYTFTGRPFAGWLYVIAHNKSLDYIRKKSKQGELEGLYLEDQSTRREAISEKDAAYNPEIISENLELIEKVRDSLNQLDPRCRLLVEMAADEYTPSEMVRMLNLPPDQNKIISDALRGCRKKLRKVLEANGIKIEEYFKK